MLTIVAHYEPPVVVDRFLTRGEAETALPEYEQALRVPCEIGRTKGHRDSDIYDKIMELRNAGKTAGEIEVALGINRMAVDHYTAKLAAEGLIQSRKGAGGWKRKEGMSERDKTVLAMMRERKGPKEIHVALGVRYMTARGIVQRLRNQEKKKPTGPV